MQRRAFVLACALGLFVAACGGGTATDAPTGPDGPVTGGDAPADPKVLQAGKGVDLENKVISVGTLNDESGPAAAIGKPFAVGKRVLAARVNAGGSGVLPDGWTVALVEKDHAYNPQQSVQAYDEIRDQILFVGTSFGTPNTLPLKDSLAQDGVMAFPASLSSELASHEFTPPIGPSYLYEAMRAMDWVVEHAGAADTIQAGLVYQQDDYGQDGLNGWRAAAAHHGVTIVSEQTVSPGQQDMTAVITALKDAGANYVMLTTLPSATGPILGTAAQLQYMPVWIGNTPSWVDAFFNPEVIPAAVFTNFHWVNGLPFWGEDVPGMSDFMAAYEAHGAAMAPPDFYILVSYIQGLAQLEAAKVAIEKGDVSRKGYQAALHELSAWDGGGMIQELNLSDVPYLPGKKTRVLKPDMENSTWTEAAGYAEPACMGGGAGAAEPAAEAPADAP